SGRQPDANSARIAVGKLVVINLDERKLDELHFDIPDGMRADSPNEVVTIVQTRPIKHKVGQYEGGGRAIREDYPITVIDKASSTVLGSATFEGPNPPESTSRTNFREDVSGGPPKAEIIEYLRQLR